MTARARLSRRPLQVGGLLLATVALGTVTAPAASAMVDPNAPADQVPDQAPAPAPAVLVHSPASYLGTPDDPIQFGMGKLQISVAPEPGVSVPAGGDLSGAVVEITFPGDGALIEGDQGDGDLTISCTTDAAGTCVFPADLPARFVDPGTGLFVVQPWTPFTVEQVEAPASGLFDLPPGEDSTVHGEGQWVDTSDRLQRFAPSTTPATPSGDVFGGPGTTGSIVFYDPLVQVSGGQPGDPSVAPGAPATDTTAPAAPVVPITPAAGTTAASAAAAPTLASTGFDAGPAALVGAGLLAAGAGAVVVGRRRAAR